MIITIAIQKGGTGKSTTAAAIAQAGAKNGLRVLAIDLDTQANLTYFLKGHTTPLDSYDLLVGAAGESAIQQTEQGIYLAAASFKLSSVTTTTGSARRLEKALAPLKKKFDLIVIDTPPTVNELQYNALQAADLLIIPTQATIAGLQGLHQIAETTRAIKRSNRGLKAGVVLTAYNDRATISKKMVELIAAKAEASGFSLLKAIRQGIAIQEAQALQVNMFDYAPKAKPVQDYLDLFNTIAK